MSRKGQLDEESVLANRHGRPDNLKPYESARRLSILKKTKEVLIVDDQSTAELF